MEQGEARPVPAPSRSLTQHSQEPGVFSGVLDLLPRLGYSSLLPSISFTQQQRVLRPSDAISRPHSRSLSEGSGPESAASTSDSTEALLQAEQSEASTSGRGASQETAGQADTPAAAAARHRTGSANSFDLQVCSVYLLYANCSASLYNSEESS